MERRIWLKWAVGQEVADKIYNIIEDFECTSKRQCYFITGSFTWNTTEEGYDYWSAVNSEITKYFDERINPKLASYLKGKGLWWKFVDNFNPPYEQDSYSLEDAFLWTTSPEGLDFWSKVSDEYAEYCANNCYHYQDDKLSSLTNKSDYENRLQGEEDPRREGDGSERSGVYYKGDESRFKLCYPLHRKTVNFSKREVGDFKVHLSSRHPVLL